MAEGQSVLNQVLEDAGKKQKKSEEKKEDANEEKKSEPETEVQVEETQEDAGTEESSEEPQEEPKEEAPKEEPKEEPPKEEPKEEPPKEEPAKAEEKKPEPRKQPEQRPRIRAAPNVVLVGKKPTMSYVLAVVTQFSDGMDDVHIKARGRSISRAVDVAEVVRNRFVQGAKIDVQIGTDEIIDENNNKINVSTIDIQLNK